MNIREKFTISDVKNEIKIDFTNCKIIERDYLGNFIANTELKPIDYLKFAKEDFKIDNTKGLIDGLCNAKRAIDCQIDCIIDYLGYEYKEFEKRGMYEDIKKFINDKYESGSSAGITLKMKYLNILNLLPTMLIGKIRGMRNLVEHEYIIPQKNEVIEAIEVAELFIYSSNKKINDTISEFCLGSNYKTLRSLCLGSDTDYYEYDEIFPNFLSIEFHGNKKRNFQIVLVKKTKGYMIFDDSSSENIYFNVDSKSPKYPYLLKMFFNKDYTLLPEIFGFEIPKEYIKFSITAP